MLLVMRNLRILAHYGAISRQRESIVSHFGSGRREHNVEDSFILNKPPTLTRHIGIESWWYLSTKRLSAAYTVYVNSLFKISACRLNIWFVKQMASTAPLSGNTMSYSFKVKKATFSQWCFYSATGQPTLDSPPQGSAVSFENLQLTHLLCNREYGCLHEFCLLWFVK